MLAARAPLLLCVFGLILLRDPALNQLRSIRERSTLLKGFYPPEAELYAWLRSATPKDAVFLVPPSLENARYNGQRAVVVDWKGFPMVPAETLEWYRRFQDVTGRSNPRGFADTAGYDSLDPARLEALKTRYRFDYVVVGRGREAFLPGYRRVYENAAFVVLEVRTRA